MTWSKLYTCTASVMFYELMCLSFLKYHFVKLQLLSMYFQSCSVVFDITGILITILISDDSYRFHFQKRNVKLAVMGLSSYHFEPYEKRLLQTFLDAKSLRTLSRSVAFKTFLNTACSQVIQSFL